MKDVIVIGGSAGSIEPLRDLVAALPRDLPASVFVVVHIPRDAPSVLPEVLGRTSRLPAARALDGEPMERGKIYVAPPDHHLQLREDRIDLGRGPRENGHRPSIDVLFRSAARCFADRVIAVVLSGAGDDGRAGALAIEASGGLVAVQDPDEAQFRRLPDAVVEVLPSARRLGAKALGAFIATEVEAASAGPAKLPIKEYGTVSNEDDPQAEAIRKERDTSEPSQFACPECGGVLWQIKDGELTRYRCRVGHAYTEEALLSEQRLAIEAALWSGMRAIEEKIALMRRMAARMREEGRTRSAEHFEDEAEKMAGPAEILRGLLEDGRLD